MNEETKTISDKIPFIMLIASVFTRGSIFTFLNFPLLFLFLSPSKFSNLAGLISDGFLKTLVNFVSNQSTITSGLVIILMLFMIGFFTSPIESLLSMFFAAILEFRKNFRKKSGKDINRRFFSGLVFPDDDYIKVMDWFAENPNQKLQWEWQQFYYHIWWSLASSLLVFTGLSFSLISVSGHQQALIILVPINVLYISGAIYHSWHMGKVHNMAIRNMKEIEIS